MIEKTIYVLEFSCTYWNFLEIEFKMQVQASSEESERIQANLKEIK